MTTSSDISTACMKWYNTAIIASLHAVLFMITIYCIACCILPYKELPPPIPKYSSNLMKYLVNAVPFLVVAIQ